MRLRHASLVLPLTATALLAVGDPAQAAVSGPYKAGCSGQLLKEYDLMNTNGRRFPIGQLQVWYSSAEGGTNCIRVRDDIAGGDVSIRMTLIVDDNDNDRADASDRQNTVTGEFNGYTGGSFRRNTDGRCIYASASMQELENGPRAVRGSANTGGFTFCR